MKYKLLKKCIGTEIGTIFSIKENPYCISLIEGNGLGNIDKLILAVGIHDKEYFEEIPENIIFYEFCYYSNQCEVPERIQKIILINFLLNRKNLEPLY